MVSHRADRDRDDRDDLPETATLPPVQPDAIDHRFDDEDYHQDLADLVAASTRLREIGEQVDEGHRAAITLAVQHAVAEAGRVADERAANASRKAYVTVVIVSVLLALVVSLPFAVTGYVKAQQANFTATQLAAGDAASAEVLSARSSSLGVVRRDLNQVVNPARVAAGLSACPDPGPQANAYQVAWVIGSCAGELRAFADLAKRGRPVPGVNAPDPDSGSFLAPAR